jgi:hypothetical protein
MADMNKNNNFISTKYKVGGNTGHLVGTPDQSFGRMKYFFRLDFTSGNVDKPTVFVDWAQLRCTSRTRTSSTGKMSMGEWTTGPQYNPDCNPFLSMQDVQPSRFALAYGPTITTGMRQHKRIGFLALDPERLGDNVEDSFTQDFGDNCLTFYLPEKNKKPTDSCGDGVFYHSDNDEVGGDNGGGGIEGAEDSDNDNEEDDSGNNDDNDRDDSSAHDDDEEGGGNGGALGVVGGAATGIGISSTLFSPSVLRYLQYK